MPDIFQNSIYHMTLVSQVGKRGTESARILAPNSSYLKGHWQVLHQEVESTSHPLDDGIMLIMTKEMQVKWCVSSGA